MVAARATLDLPPGLADSKTLSKKKRESLFSQIKLSCDLGEGWVSSIEIDKFGLTKAMRLGVARALKAINATTDEEIILDGLINYCDPLFINVKCVAKADSLYPIVSAASIYAKVLRDKYMANLNGTYAVYEFGSHVGYGTKLHLDSLIKHGISDQHRLSFAPVKRLVNEAAALSSPEPS